ncbi:hypothetical protein [Candidatus Ichthyocystis sparus]|uniref:hypothetical protein n=1 Tax=Candidatus Ichthyocystis sparus TaxID=1561004 RepID=UPI000B888678|nr:hypothetical protein [Candidatus Ichthyocystis sparus]
MSDKRIYGTSGSGSGSSSSEPDEPANTGRSESLLGAVGQDTGGETGKSGDEAGGRRGSGAPLTSPGGSGSSQELAAGARPKIGHGGDKKGRHRKKKDDDIWHNTARKSAKSLKGQGRFLASSEGRGKSGGREESLGPLSFLTSLRAHEEGPRSTRAYGGRKDKSQRKIFATPTRMDLVCSVCIGFAVILAPFTLLLALLGFFSSNDTAGPVSDTQGSASGDKPVMKKDSGVTTTPVMLLYLFFFMCIVVLSCKHPLKKGRKHKK